MARKLLILSGYAADDTYESYGGCGNMGRIGRCLRLLLPGEAVGWDAATRRGPLRSKVIYGRERLASR